MSVRIHPGDTTPRDGTSSKLRRFDLSLSENPFPPLPAVLEAVHRELAAANRYPEFLPEKLPALIARELRVHPDQVVVGAGATGVAMQVLRAVVEPGRSMVFAAPTFDGYPIMAGMAGVRAVPVPLDARGGQDVRALRRAIDRHTRLLVVCRPHNPTGTVLPLAELDALLARVPARVTVLLDEAYIEFLEQADRPDLHHLIAKYRNLLVLRTFSKAYGLAGLRIGYAVGDIELARRVRTQQLPFGLGAAAGAAVAASYAATEELRARVRRITEERDLLRAALYSMGIEVPESHANFLYLPGPGASNALRRRGIKARCYPDGSARIAVGDPEAGRAVLRAMRIPQ